MARSDKNAPGARLRSGSMRMATVLDAPGNETRIDVLVGEIDAMRAQIAQISKLRAALEAVAAHLDIDLDQAEQPAPSQQGQSQDRHRWPQFLAEWRKYRGQTLVSLADAVGLSKSQLSRIENGLQDYTQKVVEGYAELLGCHPADLLSRPPPSVKTASARSLARTRRSGARKGNAASPIRVP